MDPCAFCNGDITCLASCSALPVGPPPDAYHVPGGDPVFTATATAKPPINWLLLLLLAWAIYKAQKK